MVYQLNRRGFMAGTTSLAAAQICAPLGIARADTAPNPLAGIGDISVVAEGLISTEGPVWDAAAQRLIFTDIPGDTIYTYTPASGVVATLRQPSDMANGLLLDGHGGLLAAEQRTRMITRMDLATGEVEPFITEYDGKKLNSPNDMYYHSTGLLFFTDPPYGLRDGLDQTRYLDFNGFYARQPDGTIELLESFAPDVNPNGVILSPDEKTLYLCISSKETGPLLAYDVAADGTLSNQRTFAEGVHNDGLAVDVHGNVYVGNQTGIFAYAPDGTHWGTITLPGHEVASNVIFGGAAMSTLFITCRGPNVYAVELNTKGIDKG